MCLMCLELPPRTQTACASSVCMRLAESATPQEIFGIAYAGMLHERIVFTHMHAAVCGKVQCSSVRVTHKRTKITLTIMHVLCVMQHQYIMVAAVCTALHNVTLPKVGAACMLAFSAVMLQSSEQAWSCRLIWTSWRGSLTLKTQKKKTSPSDSQHCLRFASTCAMHPADFHLLTRCVILITALAAYTSSCMFATRAPQPKFPKAA